MTNPQPDPANKALSDAVHKAIDKLGPDDIERIRAEVVLTDKVQATRREIRTEVRRQASGKSRSKLTSVQAYKVMQWIDSQRDYIPKSQKTYEELVDECSKSIKIGCPVEVEAFRRLVHEMGVKATRVRPANPAGLNGKASEILKTLTALVAHQGDRIAYLEKQLGVTPPAQQSV